jgi:hypothetical protein
VKIGATLPLLIRRSLKTLRLTTVPVRVMPTRLVGMMAARRMSMAPGEREMSV